MYWQYPPGYYHAGDYQIRMYMEQMERMRSEQLAAIRELIKLTRENHQLLTMIYSRVFGTYPPCWECK
jgi:hypothetical protein